MFKTDKLVVKLTISLFIIDRLELLVILNAKYLIFADLLSEIAFIEILILKVLIILIYPLYIQILII